MSLCSPEQNGANACLFVFSRRSRNGGRACLFVFVPPVFVGGGGDRCKRS